MENQQEQQITFQDYIINSLGQIIQSDLLAYQKCNSIISNQFSTWLYYELISTINLNSNIFNRNPTPQLIFLCSELFENANQEFIDYLFDLVEGLSEDQAETKRGLFRYLISVVEQDFIAETTCGYFYKVMNSIIQKRGADVCNFLENDQRIISSFLKHVDQPHICRIITELILFANQPSKILDYSYLAQQISDRLFKIMERKSHQITIVDNICEIFVEILTRKSQNPNLDIQKLISIKPSQLFQIAVQSNSEGPHSLLILLLEYAKNNQQDHVDSFIDISHLIPLEFEKTYLTNIQQDRYFNKLFGRKNMKLLFLTSQLIQLNNKSINSKLIDNGLVNVLVNTIQEFPIHNQLHFTAFEIFEKLIESEQIDNILDMIDSLCNFIVTQLNQTQNYVGYRAFLSKLANYLINKQHIPAIQKALKNNQYWEGFVQTRLKDINQVELNFLFNINPRCKILT
ncbi:unnamed protein product (macronuclear) [Paramecium tetraurelia]|uniref:Uncharacterized protein n=1 Tax=Paramecium tetraurelia TaxID=5888 RepID=A0D048_PARTE|nr:uncharacterized protein GSPATT00011967001 [Paramecium tetraurelia]CAK76415.1 unnamed protein product [Paramecium tetraurelia]|eukprot:XP_001443812.1 hypothetical protein (macronuclear) [Paramecium tetraurelia strain d4-2]